MPPDDTPLVIESGDELPAREISTKLLLFGYVACVERLAGQTYK